MPRNDDETIAFLQLLGHGEFLGALHDSRLALEKAVSDTGKAGELVLKIKVAPNGHNKRLLTFEVREKLPVVPASATYCWATEAGQYVENDPEQMRLPLNVVPVERPELRTAGA